MKAIPNIQFESKNPLVDGLEIIRLESLAGRKDALDHDPEKAHQLEFNVLIFYTSGNSQHLVDFVWHDVRKHTLIHLSKGQVCAYKFNKEIKGFIILFTDQYLEKHLSKLPKNEVVRLFNSHLFSPKIQVPEDSNVAHYIQLFFDEFSKGSQDLNSAKVCDSLYAIIFSKLEQLKQYQTFHLRHTDKLELFLRFKNLVAMHFKTSRNADFYAAKLHITYKHLNTVCKTILNTTAKSFIDEYVILEAKRRLINSTVKSSELAFQMGFDEPTNFVKYFKKNTGLTPNSFKNSYK